MPQRQSMVADKKILRPSPSPPCLTRATPPLRRPQCTPCVIRQQAPQHRHPTHSASNNIAGAYCPLLSLSSVAAQRKDDTAQIKLQSATNPNPAPPNTNNAILTYIMPVVYELYLVMIFVDRDKPNGGVSSAPRLLPNELLDDI